MDPRTRTALVIEDAPEFARTAVAALAAAGWDVVTAVSGEGGLARARALEPDLVLVDVGLPGADGYDVVRELRTFSDAYVIIVSGRTSEAAVVVGLEMGADDYLAKPYAPRELVARADALSRRPRSAANAHVRRVLGAHGELVVDATARSVRLQGRPVPLSPAEIDLLLLLTARPGQVATRDSLTAALWGSTGLTSSHSLDVLVANLRRKLGDDARRPRHVVTVRGVGFRYGAGGAAVTLVPACAETAPQAAGNADDAGSGRPRRGAPARAVHPERRAP